MSDWKVMLTDWEVSEEDIEAVLETLRSGWLTMGPKTQELEAAFAAASGAGHAIAVSSGTAALHLICLAAGVGPGDEVIVPAMSFAADAHSPAHCGARPVFADVASAQVPLMGPEQVEPLIGERTRAVIAVHMFGHSGPAEDLAALCCDRGVTLIEDCAQAAGARFGDGRWVGRHGIAGAFSFFSKTALGVGEGGIVITDDAEVADRVRLLRSHAMTSVTWDRHRGHAETYDVVDLGYNYRLDEPRATLALSRLKRLGTSLDALRSVAGTYRELLGSVDGVELTLGAEEIEYGGHFAYPILLSDTQTRDRVRTRLREAGIETTLYPALTQLSEYRGAGSAPNAEDFADRHVALPIYAGLEPGQLELIAGELRDALA